MTAGEPDLLNIGDNWRTIVPVRLGVCSDRRLLGRAPHVLLELGPPLVERDGVSERAYNAVGSCVGEFDVVHHAYGVDRVPKRR
jgi:hypothetical protein